MLYNKNLFKYDYINVLKLNWWHNIYHENINF